MGAVIATNAASAERTISTRAPVASRTGSIAVKRAGSEEARRKIGEISASILNNLHPGYRQGLEKFKQAGENYGWMVITDARILVTLGNQLVCCLNIGTTAGSRFFGSEDAWGLVRF
jgi:hypothetical protein